MSSLDTDRPTFDDLELLASVSQLLTTLDLDRVLQRVVDMVVAAVGATRASLYFFEGQDLDWYRIITTDESAPDGNRILVTRFLNEGLAGWVVRHKQAAIVSDTRTDERWYDVDDPDHPAYAALCVPFIHEGDVVAIMTLYHTETNYFTEYHLRMLTIIANQVVIAARQVQTFDRLQAQQHQLEVILQAIPDAIMVLDKIGRIRLVNEAALPLLGNRASDQIIDCHLDMLTSIDSALMPIQGIFRDIANSPLRSGTQWSFESHSDGLKKDYQVSISLWRDMTRDVDGYVVVLHDVTQLRDLHRFKDEMLRVASHDLRSPLSLIMGYIDLIAQDLPTVDSPIHEYLDVIHTSTERMNGLLDDLLRVEQIRTSPLELHERVDPQKLVKVVLVNTRPFAVKKNQRFQPDIQLDGITNMMADPVLIRQAMENLVSNAIKYTPEGGRIGIKAYVENGYFSFVVEDSGIGIPKDALPHIFDSFYRVKSAKTQHISGTGLGLSLVKTVIERHNGEIRVESEEDKGSRFAFSIPL